METSRRDWGPSKVLAEFPTGTVTFLFTDIEGSTRLLQDVGESGYSDLLNRHHKLIRDAIAKHHGHEISTEGDSFFAVFGDVVDAVGSATSIQRAMAEELWPHQVALSVRIGIHTGTAHVGGDNYVGVDVHRAARISAAAHGGQVLLSGVSVDIIGDQLPFDVTTRDLGNYRLSDLQRTESIHQLDIAGLAHDFPPLRRATTLSRLPETLTKFLGRTDELTLGGSLLSEYRLVTLTGPGGTGKTRLAIEIARINEPLFPDGAFFVSLAQLTGAELIPTTIFDSLGIPTTGNDPKERLLRLLSDKQMLLVLDNFEQLQSGAALVSEMLGRAPGVKALVTSRAPLRIAGERQVSLQPLPTPDRVVHSAEAAGAYPGVKLFELRSAAVRPGFQLTDDNAVAVAAIASRLDGLPLAIELAASRMRTLTPDLILERLDNRMLSIKAPELPGRQQTITETIGWSYDLLDEQQRRLFEECSVFNGSFDLRVAEVVADSGIEVLDGLIDLVEHSLIMQPETSGDPRFRMLTVVKEYAHAALVARGGDTEISVRHADAFLAIAEEADAGILTSKQSELLDRIARDHDNFRAAVDWSIREQRTSLALRLVASLWRFWQIRGHLFEAETRVEAALALEGGSSAERAAALTALGGLRYWRGSVDGPMEPYREALELLKDNPMSLEYADALYNLSFPLQLSGDRDGARDLALESLRISESLDHELGVGRAHFALCNVGAADEDYDQRIEHAEIAAAIFESLDAPFDLAWSWWMISTGLAKRGDVEGAMAYALKTLDVFAGSNDLSALTLVLEVFGYLLLQQDRHRDAATIAGVVNRLRVETGVEIGDLPFNQFPWYVEYLENPDKLFRAAYEEGQALSIEEALSVVRDS